MENNLWLDIIKEALLLSIAEKGSAVTGAKLRSKTASIAKIRKLEFPPLGMGKFSSFVESYPKEFIVSRQAGQDILITSSERPELLEQLTSESDTSSKRLREDIFTGMTQIGGEEMPVYLRDTDRVIWTSIANRPSLVDAIDFPSASLEKEKKVRRDFAEQVEDATACADLLAALETTGPLKSFTAALHSAKLFKEWHVYRFNAMSRELAEWAARNGVQWQESWLSLAEPKMVSVAPLPIQTSESSAIEENPQWLELASRLTKEDISRITIPLDIVLRLVSKS
jgi:hypothetical protein